MRTYLLERSSLLLLPVTISVVAKMFSEPRHVTCDCCAACCTRPLSPVQICAGLEAVRATYSCRVSVMYSQVHFSCSVSFELCASYSACAIDVPTWMLQWTEKPTLTYHLASRPACVRRTSPVMFSGPIYYSLTENTAPPPAHLCFGSSTERLHTTCKQHVFTTDVWPEKQQEPWQKPELGPDIFEQCPPRSTIARNAGVCLPVASVVHVVVILAGGQARRQSLAAVRHQKEGQGRDGVERE